MRWLTRRLTLLCLHAAILALPMAPGLASETERPFIWVKAEDKPAILKKIEEQPWAESLFAELRLRADAAAPTTMAERREKLIALPLVWSEGEDSSPTLVVFPRKDAFADGRDEQATAITKSLQDGIDCGVLFYLTGQEIYARCAADILFTFANALPQIEANRDYTTNGGWLYQGDHLREVRIVSAQLPIIYDFVQPWLKKGGTAYDMASGEVRAFDFEAMQEIFRTYIWLALNHGLYDSNWPALESPGLVHNMLGLDDAEERAATLPFYLTVDTEHVFEHWSRGQPSLARITKKFKNPGDVWPESLGYSVHVASNLIYVMTVFDRIYPELGLGKRYRNVPAALNSYYNLRFPNGDTPYVGDGSRRQHVDFQTYEKALQLAVLNGSTDQAETFADLLAASVASGTYDRAALNPRSYGWNHYLTPLQLLWSIDDPGGDANSNAAPPHPRSNHLPHAGLYIQRNISDAQPVKDSLMAYVAGGSYIHGHASGMEMELYGQGHVLGINSGNSTYRTAIHENYYRLFASKNTVISNGASASSGGWIDLGINTVAKVAMEPTPNKAAISPNHSFSTTSFYDEHNLVAPADHQRTVALVKMSDTSGFYVDVFRARSDTANQYHDYVYHNVGDTLLIQSGGRPLPMTGDSERFQAPVDISWELNGNYQHPGWHYFEDVKTGKQTDRAYEAIFAATELGDTPIHMRAMIPAGLVTEMTRVNGPPSKGAHKGYEKKPLPAFVMRHEGEAWDNPFVAVYESYGDKPSVQSVERLMSGNVFKGIRINSVVDGQDRTHYILLQEHPNDVFVDRETGIAFKGRFGVVAVDPHGALSELYIGDGEQLTYGATLLTTPEGTRAAYRRLLNARLPADELEAAFVTPPESVQTAVYWYWISGNISKEGVVKDLHSMKAAGINRAFIGNIGLESTPYGEVKMLSDDWWDILHLALKTATELDIEIGIFNSPGWSQSGGPWVKPESAMRYLAASETRVQGPVRLSQKLERPIEPFQDVKVVAYPAPANNELVFHSSDIEVEQAFTARSLSIRTIASPVKARALFQARNEKGEFVTVKDFEIDRSNPALNVGFIPYAPVVVSFPAVTSHEFRLLLSDGEPSDIAEIVISSAPRVERYAEKTLAKMFPTPLPYWEEYQWPPQAEVDDSALVIDPSQVVDISHFMAADGTLNWDVPEGDWVILRTGMTPTGTENGPAAPEATGYEVDKMSKVHAEKHFYAHMGEVLKRIPEADRKSFKVVVQDSYETGGQNFTDGFLKEFAAEYGYDPLPYLPVYQGTVVKSQQASDRFLWDMRRLVANKVAYDYVGGLREVSHKHGLTTWLENYGHWGFPGEFLMYGGQSDEIGGEFWSEGELGDIENRAATSSGHIYGKTRIWAESNTAGGKAFARYPATIKQRGDRFFAEGINATLLHVYITQPYEDKNPGVNTWFGTEFNRKNTWFSQIDVYTQYLKRVNYMLQQGLNVADVAYFIGEDAPKMTGVTDPALPIGYQFDYMNAEVIEKYMTVKDGLLTLPHGTQYKVMVLPKLATMRPGLLAEIKQLVHDGAVVLGPSPTRSPSLQNQPEADQQVHAMATELWGDVDGVNVTSRVVGKGMIIDGLDMTQAFDLINSVPDCRLPDDNSIHYGHRTLGDQEIYFLSNQTGDTQVITPEFRVAGMQPELWEATTGYRRDLPAYEQSDSVTAVPLKLEPHESVFVVFRKPAGQPRATGVAANYPDAEQIQEIETPWTVSFDPAQRGPEEAVVFESLTDWTASDDERIKYYSGTAFYDNTFMLEKLPDHTKVIIDLGKFTAMAEVTVNGRFAGGLWTAPHRLDISGLVREGNNELRIEVVNTWVNRIIGDMRLPAERRKTWMLVNPYDAESPLQPSGLLGPVTIANLEQ